MTFLEKVEHAKRVIKDAVEKHPKICVGVSFGKDSMVVLDLALKVAEIPVISVLATTEFPETDRFALLVRDIYNLNLKTFRFQQEKGFLDDPSLCCGKPKVEKFKESLKPYDAWISGVRRTEGITRADFQEVEERDGLTKINPILDFTETDIWRYIAINSIPVNPKYSEGYRSLGCKYCSFPEVDGTESERAGRWKGTSKACGECGIHQVSLR